MVTCCSCRDRTGKVKQGEHLHMVHGEERDKQKEREAEARKRKNKKNKERYGYKQTVYK